MHTSFASSRLTLVLGLAAALGLTACFGSDDKAKDPAPTDGISDNLHFAFKTPEWERQIDCEQLAMPFSSYNGVAGVGGTSASTAVAFYFQYPADSTALVQAAVLRRYPIARQIAGSRLGELSLRVPVTAGSSSFLMPKAGQSATSYNEIVSVKYTDRRNGYPRFDIKCRYQAMMGLATDSTAALRPVSGTYHLRVVARPQ